MNMNRDVNPGLGREGDGARTMPKSLWSVDLKVLHGTAHAASFCFVGLG
jgi:hypothetical protein